MILNEPGIIAEQSWIDIPKHFTNTELDYYVIMPNHIHGIIILNQAVETRNVDKIVETPYMASLPLGDIIGKYKAAVKRRANKNGYNNFSWQTRFYDRIIRNEKELYNIRKYIDQNPLKWDLEKDQPENICEL
jgi:REP element-mobilizing transposase RayT